MIVAFRSKAKQTGYYFKLEEDFIKIEPHFDDTFDSAIVKVQERIRM